MSGKGWGCLLLALGSVLLLLCAGMTAYRLNRALTYGRAIAVQMDQVQQYVTLNGTLVLSSAEGTANLQQALQAIRAEVAVIRRDLHPALEFCPLLGWVPKYGPTLEAVPALLDILEGSFESCAAFLDILHAAALQPGPADGPLAASARAIQTQPELLVRAAAAWSEVEAARASFDATALAPPLAAPLATFDELAVAVRAGLDIAAETPYLFGIDGPRTYLILAQSEDELRPTGGFITAAGYIVVADGRITEMEIGDSYALDDLSRYYPDPPEPLFEYMGAPQWLLRDANWSPDFAETAEIAAGLARIGTGRTVDGVIAMDQAAIRYILDAVGPVEVVTEQRTQTVTAGNFFDWMHQSWAPSPEEAQDRAWWTTRKTFVGDLASALRHKLESGGGVDTTGLLLAVVRALDEKHLLVYVRRQEIVDALAGLHWDGRVDQGGGDYLMVVEANVGFNKASPLLERRLEQRVDLAPDGSAQVEAIISYRHLSDAVIDWCDPSPRYDPAYADMMDRCYWNYLRLLVPASAELQSAPDMVVPAQNLTRRRPSRASVDVEYLGDTRQSWGKLVLLKPGEQLILRYEYRLPHVTRVGEDGVTRYELLLQKQPGLKGFPTTLIVTLPEGAALLRSLPAPAETSARALEFRFDLITDRRVSIEFVL